MTRPDTDRTAPAVRALRQAESFAPGAVAGVAGELSKVRRRIRAGDLRRAAVAAEEAGELAAALRLEAAGPGVSP